MRSMLLTVDSSRDFSTSRFNRSIIIFSRFLPTESKRSRADCSRVRSLRSVNASASLSAFSSLALASASAAFTISVAFSLALAMIAAASFSALSTASFWMRSIRYCKSSAIYISNNRFRDQKTPFGFFDTNIQVILAKSSKKTQIFQKKRRIFSFCR